MAFEKITPEVIAKLTAAFGYNANVTAACAYAGISRELYYSYIKENPEFSDTIEELKQQPYLKGVMTVVKNIEKDPDFALKYLKLRHPEEFRTRQQLADPNDNPVQTSHDDIKEIAEAIRNANAGTPPNDPTTQPDEPGEQTGTSPEAL